MQTLFVGIDVSLHKNDVVAMIQDGTTVDSFQVTNDLPGTQELCRRLAAILSSRRLDHLVVGLEATGLYGWHLRRELAQSLLLQPYRPLIHPFNPKLVAGFKNFRLPTICGQTMRIVTNGSCPGCPGPFASPGSAGGSGAGAPPAVSIRRRSNLAP